MYGVNNKFDAVKLQRDLDNLFCWSNDWKVLFNLDKCHIMHFGDKKLRHVYTVNGHELSKVSGKRIWVP